MLRHVRSRLGSTLSTERVVDVDRMSIADVAASLGLEPTGDPGSDRDAIAEVLGDPELALQVLEQLPVVCSVVLEGLIEMRGQASPHEIRDLIDERTALGRSTPLEDIAAVLALYGLATVHPDCLDEWEPMWLFLTREAAQCCPALLRGLTLPRTPEVPPTPEGWDAAGEVEMLAFVRELDRRALRLTRSALLHRGDMRGHARALGCTTEEVEARFFQAVELGLVGLDYASRIWPDATGIRRALASEVSGPPQGSIEKLVWEILPEDGWAPEEAIARACVRIAGLRSLPTVARGVRVRLQPTIWVEAGHDVSGIWYRRRDGATIRAVFQDAAAWRALAAYKLRPQRLTPLTRTQESIEAELRHYIGARIGDHSFEKLFMPDVPEDEQGLWVPLTCDAAESLRVRYEQAMAHGFAGDRYELPGHAPLLFSDPGWRPRPFSQAQLHAAIEDAASAKRPIEIHVERGNETAIHWVRPIRVHTEGRERSVLAVEVDTDVGLVFPLAQIIEVDTVRRFTG